ncbi:MAG: CopG family transcriptional regulator [Candidatus Dormibacteria bacterium]
MPKQTVPAENEKLTINLGVVDLGQIDLLVEDGFYGNRADFVRTAVRTQLQQHAAQLQGTVARRMMVVGVTHISKSQLEDLSAKQKTIDVKVTGLLHIAADVPAELARQTIQTVEVRGVFRASDPVKKALAGRIN